MKNNFPTLWKETQKGFITIPILIIAILVTMVVGGGGFAVYKYNEVAKEKEIVETQLNEQKDKEIQRLQEQVIVLQEPIGTSTTDTVIDEELKENELLEKKQAEIDSLTKTKAKQDAIISQQKTTEQAKVDDGIKAVLDQKTEADKTAFVNQLTTIYNDYQNNVSNSLKRESEYKNEGDYEKASRELKYMLAHAEKAQTNAKNLSVFFNDLPPEYIQAAVNMEQGAYYFIRARVNVELGDNEELAREYISKIDPNINAVYSFLQSVQGR